MSFTLTGCPLLLLPCSAEGPSTFRFTYTFSPFLLGMIVLCMGESIHACGCPDSLKQHPQEHHLLEIGSLISPHQWCSNRLGCEPRDSPVSASQALQITNRPVGMFWGSNPGPICEAGTSAILFCSFLSSNWRKSSTQNLLNAGFTGMSHRAQHLEL